MSSLVAAGLLVECLVVREAVIASCLSSVRQSRLLLLSIFFRNVLAAIRLHARHPPSMGGAARFTPSVHMRGTGTTRC